MPNLRRTYSQGRMRLDIENRLLPDGEYREAFNALIYNNESNEEGSVRKAFSNKQLTNLDLGLNPKCILGISHPSRNRVYWGVVSDSGSYLLEYDFTNEIATFVLKDTRAIGSRVFDLNEDFLCTGVEILSHDDINKELFLMTDDNMHPLCFNIERAKTWAENGFDKEDIFLIKKPPRYAPVVTPVYTNDRSNNLEDRFLTFSYRYKYLDGEYSALSSYTNYGFNPKKFELDYFTLVNKGMINRFNAVKIDFNTGDKRVVEIQLVVKETNSNIPYIIETYNKLKEGFGDNEVKSFIFSNQKLYQALPERELYRLFDNVPLKAKALTLIGNRPIFGNYLEFFDIKDINGNEIVIDYDVSLVSEEISQGIDLEKEIPTADTFTFETATGITYTEGYVMYFLISVNIGLINVYQNEFSFILPQDYTTLNELVASPDFIAFVEVMNSHFVANYNSESQYDVDPDYALNTDTSIEFALVSGVPTFTVNPILFNDTASGGALVTVDLSFNNSSNVGITSLFNTSSCKSNKNYEVGLVYIEEFNRATTVQTSKNNTIFIPQQYSIFKNKLRVTLNNLPPYWADRYKLVVKTNALQYQTIYVNEFYNQDNYVWAKLQSDNKDKVKVGDTLILKVGGSVVQNQPKRIKVLEIKEFDKDFIDNNQDENGNDIIETAGVYMRIRPDGFSMDLNDYTINQSEISPPGSSSYPIFYLDLFTQTTPSLSELAVPQGSSIYIFINSNRNYNSGWVNVTYENTFFTQRNYATLEEWFNEVFLNGSFIPGLDDSTGETEDYAPNLELVRGNITIPFGSYQQFTPDPLGKLYLKIKGLRSGGSNNRDGYGFAKIVVRNSTGVYVFETDPRQVDSEIFYETEQTFDIIDGEHQGNIQNQNNTTLEPAIIDLDFFNCFAQGNGVESFRVRDEFNSRYLNIDLRPSTTTVEPYKQVRRFADLTYGDPYVESSGINGMNVFNLSTANFKDDLDKQYGSIQKLFSRENDIVVLQEDKSGKVLFNKQAIYTADGNAALTATPNILGQYIPYMGNRGIGKNPESFSVDDFGRIKYASVRTGSIVRLSIDGIEDIIYGIKNFVFDLFSNRTKGKIISGYDPSLDLTTFTIEENVTETPIYNCGNEIVKNSVSEPFVYILQLNELTGEISFNYNITEGTATIQVVHNGITNVVSGVSGVGIVTVDRDGLSIDTALITITPVTEVISFEVINNCPIGVPLDIVLIVLNDINDSEKTILNRFRSDLNGFIQNEDLFTDGPITRFQTLSGLEGQSLFPTEGSTITIQSIKGNSNTASFLPITECNKIGYLISDTVYTEATVNDLLDATNYLTLTETIQGIDQNTFTGNFVFSRPIGTEKLYLIWDYTNRKPIAVNDFTTVDQGGSVIISPLSNDIGNGTITLTITTPPENGLAVVNLDNTITYTHDNTETFIDGISYTIDNGVCSSSAMITISINSEPVEEDWNFEAFRSLVGLEIGDDICSETLSVNCKIFTQSGGTVIQTGDRVFNDDASPFDGENKYYLLKSALATSGQPSYGCFVNNLGYINLLTICI